MPKVVFILGAGASCHLEFPTGPGLIADIIGKLSADSQLSEIVTSVYGEDLAKTLASALDEAAVESIDQFVRNQVDDALRNVCRFVIAYRILQAEENSKAVWRDRNKLEGNWYYLFRQYLQNNPQIVAPDSFAVLSFNYDRSFEYFMQRALEHDKRIPAAMRGTLLDVFHLHGTPGNLPQMATVDVLEYGGGEHFRFEVGPGKQQSFQKNLADARSVANRLIFTHDSVDYGVRISRTLLDAKLVVIIGFRFAPDNCRKVLLREVANRGTPIIATSFGLREEDHEFLSTLQNISLYDKRSDEFFRSTLRRRLDDIFGTAARI